MTFTLKSFALVGFLARSRLIHVEGLVLALLDVGAAIGVVGLLVCFQHDAVGRLLLLLVSVLYVAKEAERLLYVSDLPQVAADDLPRFELVFFSVIVQFALEDTINENGGPNV